MRVGLAARRPSSFWRRQAFTPAAWERAGGDMPGRAGHRRIPRPRCPGGKPARIGRKTATPGCGNQPHPGAGNRTCNGHFGVPRAGFGPSERHQGKLPPSIAGVRPTDGFALHKRRRLSQFYSSIAAAGVQVAGRGANTPQVPMLIVLTLRTLQKRATSRLNKRARWGKITPARRGRSRGPPAPRGGPDAPGPVGGRSRRRTPELAGRRRTGVPSRLQKTSTSRHSLRSPKEQT